ncbi:MAG: ketopantoate reductase family protein [Deltaproteobacteria bacterium]|nr:ketopantoate reductase family protein [Deltaproteobacteria bacterium]
MTSPIKTISLIGAGAVGAVYASKFYTMDKNCISLVAKGERYDRLREKGLFVNKRHYLLNVIRPEENTPPSDLIIVAVKHHHLEEAIRDISNRVGDDTLILSAMNGIESEEQISAAYGREKVLLAVAVGIDAVRQENRITFSQQGKLFFGEARNPNLTERVKRVRCLLDQAGISYEIPDDMIRILWWKFMINVGLNQVSAILGAPYSVFQNSQEARELLESAMREVINIAKPAGVHLSVEDIQDFYSFLPNLSPDGKTSMLQDVEAKRKTEVEMFAGKVIELGKKYGIPTPVNQTLYRLIKVIEGDIIAPD